MENLSKSLIKCLTRTQGRKKTFNSAIVQGKKLSELKKKNRRAVEMERFRAMKSGRFCLCVRILFWSLNQKPFILVLVIQFKIYALLLHSNRLTRAIRKMQKPFNAKAKAHHITKTNKRQCTLNPIQLRSLPPLFFQVIWWTYHPKCYCCDSSSTQRKQSDNNYSTVPQSHIRDFHIILTVVTMMVDDMVVETKTINPLVMCHVIFDEFIHQMEKGNKSHLSTVKSCLAEH